MVEAYGKKLGGVYASEKLHRKRWEKWLGDLNGKSTWRELGDWNAHSHLWDLTQDENSRGKTMVEWIVGSGWNIVEGDCG